MKLKETRQAKGIGRLRAANMTGVGYPHLLRIESGKRIPRIETVMRIATGLGLDPWLVEEFLPALNSAEAAGLVVRTEVDATNSHEEAS